MSDVWRVGGGAATSPGGSVLGPVPIGSSVASSLIISPARGETLSDTEDVGDGDVIAKDARASGLSNSDTENMQSCFYEGILEQEEIWQC